MARNLCLSILSAALVAAVSASAQTPAMIKTGNVLSWTTGVGRGALKIVTVDNLYFEADQTNEMNTGAGTIRLYGGILDGGKRIVLVQPGSWKAVWDGTVSGAEINGKLQQGAGSYTFKIGPVAAPAPAPAPKVVPPIAAVSTAPFLAGKTLSWSSDAGQNGAMRVTSVTGATFLLEQTNVKNVAAGIIKMDGEVKDGKIYIYNRAWNETWIGTNVNGTVTGKVNNGGGFKITDGAPAAAATVSIAPFVAHAALNWTTDAGQKGVMVVTAVTGTTFLIDQTNVNNVAAGTIKLDGEVKDGKVYIYNRKWNETWIGTISGNGTLVTGKVNNGGGFRISL